MGGCGGELRTFSSRRPVVRLLPPNKALQLTVKPLRGFSTAELGH
jgi:hypothetical protein